MSSLARQFMMRYPCINIPVLVKFASKQVETYTVETYTSTENVRCLVQETPCMNKLCLQGKYDQNVSSHVKLRGN